MMNSEQLWYTKGLNKYLSDAGYVHFMTREKMLEDFDCDRAFYINHESKQFGLSDVIAWEKSEEAAQRRDIYRHLIDCNQG
jgi:hypothetical protein